MMFEEIGSISESALIDSMPEQNFGACRKASACVLYQGATAKLM
jgi:hypothetical protein